MLLGDEIPYINIPTSLWNASKIVTSNSSFAKSHAHVKTAGPAPMTIAFMFFSFSIQEGFLAILGA